MVTLTNTLENRSLNFGEDVILSRNIFFPFFTVLSERKIGSSLFYWLNDDINMKICCYATVIKSSKEFVLFAKTGDFFTELELSRPVVN